MRAAFLRPLAFVGAILFATPFAPAIVGYGVQNGDGTTAAATRPSSAAKSAIEEILGAEAKKRGYVGISAAIFDARGVIATAHVGFEDREKAVLCDDATSYRWASISKPITAIVAMKLAAAGVLDLDADVRSYVPEFPEKPHVVTARRLLCHQGGISHYGPNVVATKRDGPPRPPAVDVVAALDAFKETPLVATPGEKYVYTTYGYMLLGAVCERAAKKPFVALAHEWVLTPADATSVVPDAAWVDVPRRARGYRKVGDAFVPSLDRDVSWKLCGGGYTSTIGALGRFGSALLSDRLLDPKLKADMWTARALADGSKTSYGAGFVVDVKNGRRRVSHSGAQEKTATFLLLHPDAESGPVGAAVMCCVEGAKLGAVADALATVAAREASSRPAAPR